MNALLKADEGFKFGLPDVANLGQALMVFAVGIVTVFAVLLLIMFVLTIFQAAFTKKSSNQPEKIEPIATTAPVVIQKNNNDEIIVAIAAALAAAESESGVKFRVVSFNRK